MAGSSTAVQPSERDEIRDLLKRTAVALEVQNPAEDWLVEVVGGGSFVDVL